MGLPWGIAEVLCLAEVLKAFLFLFHPSFLRRTCGLLPGVLSSRLLSPIVVSFSGLKNFTSFSGSSIAISSVSLGISSLCLSLFSGAS